MQLRSMMHGEDNDKVRQTVAWTDIPYFVNHTGEIANSARKARTTRDSASPIWVFASRFCFGGFCFAMEGGLEILVAVRCRAKP